MSSAPERHRRGPPARFAPLGTATCGYRGGVFLFFSNGLGCGGSLLLSAALTLLLLLLTGVIHI